AARPLTETTLVSSVPSIDVVARWSPVIASMVTSVVVPPAVDDVYRREPSGEVRAPGSRATIEPLAASATIGPDPVASTSTAAAAGADGGGAYISFNRTYYLPGDAAIGQASASIPKSERDILDRGPFWVYVLPKGVHSLKPGPIPSGAIRVGMFVVQPERGY